MTDEDERHMQEEERMGSWWSPLGDMEDAARAGVARLQEVIQGSVNQIQEWVSGGEGPIQVLVGQVQNQTGRVQKELDRQLKAIDRLRKLVEDRVLAQLKELRGEQRRTTARLERIAIKAERAVDALQ